MGIARQKSPAGSVPTVTAGEFFAQHEAALQGKLVAGHAGLGRTIREGSINRPGLQLSGYLKNFAWQRVQIIGAGETSYLNSLPPEEARRRVRAIFLRNIPCLIVSRGIVPPDFLVEEAEATGTPLFSSKLHTMRLINTVTICLEMDFAPRVNEQGSMVDIQGIGVLLKGASGVGKSECVLSLVARGYSLVADDITTIFCLEGRELVARAPDISRFYMEVRGIGIIDVTSLFGLRAIRLEKRVDLVATLRECAPGEEIERVGLDQAECEILNIRVPHVIIPIRPGRDLATLVEVAALDQKLRAMGHNAAQEFNNKLTKLTKKR
ncbi:HPr kinase/phosphorylase [Methylacidimicrobium cyclopophantes]|uniref:HPr kinase/phosphorylase n=1 Tax=Methylacidimicrobium cyclopophantes TaxID=1041766 RepID=A0A5E6MDD6_9BACT|nr:HPr(Ser) kinase/phosphatase [Methylacidimicrobium cyclopophantes]VVM06346.1 HPr kinase/phosphorylase [Methylacidimicrobium cyclopophantes]